MLHGQHEGRPGLCARLVGDLQLTVCVSKQAYIGGDDDLLPATQHTRPVGDVESEKQNQSQGMNTGSNGGTACDIVPPQALLGSGT